MKKAKLAYQTHSRPNRNPGVDVEHRMLIYIEQSLASTYDFGDIVDDFYTALEIMLGKFTEGL